MSSLAKKVNLCAAGLITVNCEQFIGSGCPNHGGPTSLFLLRWFFRGPSARGFAHEFGGREAAVEGLQEAFAHSSANVGVQLRVRGRKSKLAREAVLSAGDRGAPHQGVRGPRVAAPGISASARSKLN